LKKVYFFKGLLTLIFCLLIVSSTATAKELSSTEANKYYKFKDNGNAISIVSYIGSESKVTIPDKINGKKVTKILENAFTSNKSIKKVVMGKYIVSIGWFAFCNCINLEALVLNQGICVLEDDSFANTGLVSVDFPDTLQRIGFLSFDGNTKLTTLKFAGDAPQILQKSFGEVLSTSLPLLKTIEIGKSATGFDDGAWNLSGLSQFFVTVEDRESTPRKAITLKAKDIEYTANGNNLTITSYLATYPDIIIPKTIAGKKVAYIGKGAFCDCGTLRSVQFGANVREISESAFENCANLEAVQFNYGLKYIQTAAFQNTQIKDLVIPSTVSVINCFAFNNVSTVETLTFYGDAPKIGGDTFGINWWGDPMPKLKQMDIPKNATGYDGDYWQNRNLTAIVSRMSATIGADKAKSKLLITINLKEK